MNKTQKVLLAVYLTLTLFIIVSDRLFPATDEVAFLKFAVMFSVFITVFFKKNKSKEQILMSFAFLFMILGDVLLVVPNRLIGIPTPYMQYGGIGFLISYIFLSVAYHKNFKLSKPEIITIIVIIVIDIFIGFFLIPYTKGLSTLFCFLFCFAISYMLWSAIATIFRNYYTKRTAYMIAFSAILMFICDIGVGFQFFHPYFSHSYNLILNHMIWIAYVPGWTLLNLVIHQDKEHLIK